MTSRVRSASRHVALGTLALTLAASAAIAQDAPASPGTGAGWMRYPAISPDGRTIVFTYKGDLYKVAATGGTASALTTHAAHDFMPVWSHDGKRIAFASDRYGNFDIYVIAAEGGAAKRLTFHSAPEYPYAFSVGDEGVIFGAARMDAAANRLYPSAAQPELWQVPAAGGRPLQLLTTPAENAQPSRDGRWIAYEDRKGGENPWRKHHVSAVARDLWMYDTKEGTHRKLTTFAGEDRNPVFADGDRTIYYLSEESGTLNVYRRAADGSGASTQLTQFKGAPVRFLSAANDGTLAFGQDGQLWTMKPGAAPVQLRVQVATDAKSNAERIVAVSKAGRGMAVSPSGKEVAFTYRGDVFVTATEGALTKRISSTPAAETDVQFSPDGKSLVYASERDGKWGIWEARIQRPAENYFFASTVVTESPLIVTDRQSSGPRLSPDGREVAYLEDRNTLRVYNRDTKQSRTLLTDREIFGGGSRHLEWSPDGKWILFDLDVPGIAPSEVGLVRADGKGKALNLTQSGFNDSDARWIQGGRAMIWFSNRDGLRSVAATGPAQQDVYAMYFDKDLWERARLSKEEFALLKEAEEKAAKTKADSAKNKADSARKENVPVVLDLDGIENRKQRLTIASASMGDVLVSKDGETLYYLARFEKGMNLWSTVLRTKETKMLLALDANTASMDWDREQKKIFLMADSTLSTIDPSGASPKREAIRLSGEMLVDEDAERRAQFDHVWRTVRDRFYTAGWHGADWNALRATYEKQLPHVANSWEFSELLAEMLGELNISHSGAAYVPPGGSVDATASLGVLLDQGWRGAGVKVDEVLRGGPLDRRGGEVKAGTVIESVDGTAITPGTDLAELLNRKAGKNVLLGYANGAAKGELVVKPVSGAEENRLLYTRWVKRNADEVARLSDGQFGYVHIPGMNDVAYRTTFEEAMGKYSGAKALVVDTRWNSGGDLVADLAMFLSGQRFFDYTTDTRSTGFEPNFRWTRPSVALANEANYSDGHCFAWTYKTLSLGTLVGAPVPGTCTFAGWETLGEGIRWGVPGVGVKDAASGKYLENWETRPDVVVLNGASAAAKGRDEQLEAAVTELRKKVK